VAVPGKHELLCQSEAHAWKVGIQSDSRAQTSNRVRAVAKIDVCEREDMVAGRQFGSRCEKRLENGQRTRCVALSPLRSRKNKCGVDKTRMLAEEGSGIARSAGRTSRDQAGHFCQYRLDRAVFLLCFQDLEIPCSGSRFPR